MKKAITGSLSLLLSLLTLVSYVAAFPTSVQAADDTAQPAADTAQGAMLDDVVTGWDQLDASGNVLEYFTDTYYTSLGKLRAWISFPASATSRAITIKGVNTGHVLANKLSASGLTTIDVPASTPADTYRATVHYTTRTISYVGGRVNVRITFYDIPSKNPIAIKHAYNPPKVTGITIAPMRVMQPGDTGTLAPTIEPAGVFRNVLSYKSSNAAVCSVNAKGELTAKKLGEAFITISAPSGVTSGCTIVVLKDRNAGVAPTAIKVNKTSLSLMRNEDATLKLTFTPAKANLTGVQWTSSNPKIAKVGADGTVTGVKAGKVTVTATSAANPNLKAKVAVTVSSKIAPPPKAQRITLTQTKTGVAMGRKVKLAVKTVTPAKASKKVTWKSSNTSVATVNSAGIVTARKKGTAVITATAADGSKRIAKCTIKVYAKSTSISVKKTLTLTAGQRYTLKPKVKPGNAYQAVTYTSSNKNVATVDAKGRIVAKQAGTARITIKTADGMNKRTTVTITVK